MSNSPLVCVCIPSFNNEATIAETLRSLVSQTYNNFIIKVFDDASTDRTAEIVRFYADKFHYIKLFVNDRNIGREANFTRCIQAGEGDYTAIFHADDIYYHDILENQTDALRQTGAAAVMTRAAYIDKEGTILGDSLFPEELKKEEPSAMDLAEILKLLVRYGNFLVSSSCMARTDVYKSAIGKWDDSVPGRAADLDVWLRFAANGGLTIIPDEQVFYRRKETDISEGLVLNYADDPSVFDVIDSYINRCAGCLNSGDMEYYSFLKFRNESDTAINRILRGMRDINIDLGVFKPAVVKRAFSTHHHFKLWMFGLMTSVLMRFPTLPHFVKTAMIALRHRI